MDALNEWCPAGRLNGMLRTDDTENMTISGPSQAPAGWYPDPGGSGLLRFYDGVAWTSHTAPAVPAAPAAPAAGFGAPTQPPLGAPAPASPVPVGVAVLPHGRVATSSASAPHPAGPYAGAPYQVPPSPGPGAHPSDLVHWLVPLGRPWQSIVAGYLALFALVIWPLGPLAVGFGVAGLRVAAHRHGHGRGRAWFAVVVGVLSTLFLILVVGANLSDA